MSNVVSLRGRNPNARFVWVEKDPAEGYVVRTNYGEGRCAADIAEAAGSGPYSREAGVVAVMFAAFLLHRDRPRIAPGTAYGWLIEMAHEQDYGGG